MARARAWHLVYVCVKRESVRGKNSAGHKGCRKVQEWEGGEGRNEGTLELEVGWWVGGGGGGRRRKGGGFADYPLHLAQLCRPTHSHQSGTPICPRLSQPLSTPPCHSIHPPVHVE